MRFDTCLLRPPGRRLALLALTLSLTGCPDEKPAAMPSRVDRVATAPAPAPAPVDTSRFCDKSFPSTGMDVTPWSPPPLRPLAGAAGPGEAKGWRWVTAWATWCSPCVEEMGLLGRWKEGLTREGVPVTFELMSVDASESEPKLREWLRKGLPGPVTWVTSPDDFQRWLGTSVGMDPDSSIPLHFVVDPSGNLRCARVGAVHAQDYGTVKALLSGR